MNNLALVLDSQGKYSEAETMYRQMLVMSEKVLGAEHPDTLISMANLAHTRRAQGNYRSAHAIIAECALISYRILGPDYPNTVDRNSTTQDWEENDC